MLYVLFGTDGQKTRDKLHNLIEQLHTRRPDAELFRVDVEHFNPEEVEGYISSQGLFENKYIVVLDKIFENEESRDFVLGLIKEIGESDNVFVLLEEKLTAPVKKKLEKYAKKVEEHNSRGVNASFNIFSLTDAIGSRNKKKAWILYQEALEVIEKKIDIHNILFWQIKGMILAATSESAKEVGMKPFPYKKAKEYSRNYSLNELKNMSKKLVTILYESRRNKGLETELEIFILSI